MCDSEAFAEMIKENVRPGDVVYRFRVILHDEREIAFIETWVYIGYVKRNCTSWDCDRPFRYYRLKNLTENAEDDFPSRSQLDNMFTLDDLEKEVASFQEESKKNNSSSSDLN